MTKNLPSETDILNFLHTIPNGKELIDNIVLKREKKAGNSTFPFPTVFSTHERKKSPFELHVGLFCHLQMLSI